MIDILAAAPRPIVVSFAIGLLVIMGLWAFIDFCIARHDRQFHEEMEQLRKGGFNGSKPRLDE